jgi:class 3 adenylate cyclase/pimeloyl-ACP methyl ester carboxylesterase
MEPRIQYAKTSDGVSIAYATAGEGKCLIVVPSPPLSHVQRQWDLYSELYRGLAQRFRAVWFDCRGSGLSDRSPIDFSPSAILRDLEAVADPAGGTQFSLYAMYDGVPFAISYAATRPEKVSHLILADGWTKFSDQDRKAVLEIEASLRHQDWTLYTETLARVLIGYDNPAFAAAVGEFIRDCVESDALRAAYSNQESGAWDIPDLLDQVKARTLVVHNRGNRFTSTESGQRLAAGIPNAQFRVIDDMTFANMPQMIDNFIAETDRTEKHTSGLPSGTALILFADIADSTALTERLGDGAFRAKARDLDAALRSVIRDHSGTTIEGKLLGDGVLAVFSSARQAIEAALACGAAGDGEGLPLHLGLHAGDVIREDNNIYGGAVNIASRISGLSAPGAVLVSDIVRGLARTSAVVRFEDRGEQSLKGVGEMVRVYEVRARA